MSAAVDFMCELSQVATYSYTSLPLGLPPLVDLRARERYLMILKHARLFYESLGFSKSITCLEFC